MKFRTRNIRFFILTAICNILLLSTVQGQFTRIPTKWQKKLRLKEHYLHEMAENEYGDIVAVGYLRASEKKQKDFLMLTFNPEGDTEALKMVGGNGDEEAFAVDMHYDGYYLAGYSNSSWKGSVGKNDIWITKLTKEGNPMWYKVFGTEEDDVALDLLSTYDGIMACGHENNKAVIYKLSDEGDLEWRIETEEAESFDKIVMLSPTEIRWF